MPDNPTKLDSLTQRIKQMQLSIPHQSASDIAESEYQVNGLLQNLATTLANAQRRNDAVVQLNQVMANVVDESFHDSARHEFLRIITEATEYGFAVLIEAENAGYQLRMTAVHAPDSTISALENLIGFELANYVLDYDPNWLQTMAPTETYQHLSELHSAIPTVLGLAIDQLLQIDHLVVIQQKSGDDLIGGVIFGANHPYVNRGLLEELCHNHLVHGLRIIREQAKQSALRTEAITSARARSAFLADISHEIRTPLNAIIGLTELLSDTPLNDQQHDFVRTILSGGNTLLELINEILDFSKIDAGKVELEELAFNIHGCIEEALDVLVPKAAEKQIDLRYVVQSDVPTWLIGDAIRLRQILINLLNNAIKFTDEGEVVLEVFLKDIQRNGRRCRLQFNVRDTGIGIPPNKLNRLFQAFSQADVTTNRKYGGTGLGLVISKRLVELMNGEIWLESKEGVGTTFFFTIEIDISTELQKQQLERPASELKGKQILIIMPNLSEREVLLDQVKRWGMIGRGTQSLATAKALTKQGMNPDLLIIDAELTNTESRANELVLSNHPHIIVHPLWALSIEANRAHHELHLKRPIRPLHLQYHLQNLLSLPAPIPQKRTRRSNKKRVKLGDQHPLRVLLVEDNAINRKVATSMLERIGYEATIATNGREALEILQKSIFDVVLMDIQMPELDGTETTEIIRKTFPAEKQPHIIAMTAHALTGDRERYLAAGMNDYLSKPVAIDTLRKSFQFAIDSQVADDSDGDENQQKGKGAVMNNEEPAIDLEAYRKIVAADDALLLEMLDQIMPIFFEDTPRLINVMTDAITIRNVKQLSDAAHTLKGSSASIGANCLSRLCHEVHAIKHHGDFTNIPEKMKQVVYEYERIENDWDDIRAQLVI